MKKIVFSFFTLFATVMVFAQEPEPPISPDSSYLNLVRMSPSDYINLKLPPLHVLVENARSAPQMNFYQATVEVEERELKTIRRNWMNYLKFNTSYNYGTSDVFNQAYIENGQPVLTNGAQRQSYWNIGAGISLPLEGLLNRRNRVKQQKKLVEKTQYDYDRGFDELRMKIIELYSTVIEQLSSLESVTESMTMAKAQYNVAESDFINGQLDAQTLSRQKSIEASAIRAYEEVRSALNSALLKLEVITNTPIISRMSPYPAPAQAE